jgi:2-methylisocitrate lyase-like PEP mutase family enzyme
MSQYDPSQHDPSQYDKGGAFRDLHHRSEPFILANAWEAGSARLLTQAGAVAIGTGSAGLAFTLGLPDGANEVDRAVTLANVAAIAAATHLPVSADLESGFSDTVDGVAETIRLAAAAGAVGGSIEDATGEPSAPIRPLAEAAERVHAAVEAAAALPFPFTVTGRAENFLYGRPDLDDTITRLRAYAEAGADVLYAPGLADAEAIRAVCAAVPKPVNVLVGRPPFPTLAELGGLGARRVSLGSLLPRYALAAVQAAARDILEQGTFDCAGDAIPYAGANELMRR